MVCMWKALKAKELLDVQGRTRRWLAEQCGIELQSLNHLLNGQRNPSRPVLLLMAQALETTVEELEASSKTRVG